MAEPSNLCAICWDELGTEEGVQTLQCGEVTSAVILLVTLFERSKPYNKLGRRRTFAICTQVTPFVVIVPQGIMICHDNVV